MVLVLHGSGGNRIEDLTEAMVASKPGSMGRDEWRALLKERLLLESTLEHR
jgi:hypothetical protein